MQKIAIIQISEAGVAIAARLQETLGAQIVRRDSIATFKPQNPMNIFQTSKHQGGGKITLCRQRSQPHRHDLQNCYDCWSQTDGA